MDTIKKVVLTIGGLAIIAAIYGGFTSRSLIEQFFPLYTGLTLIGTVLLHKEEKNLNSQEK